MVKADRDESSPYAGEAATPTMDRSFSSLWNVDERNTLLSSNRFLLQF